VGVFPAVQLFVERVTEVVEDFALTDANARWSSRLPDA
jgi:predicted ATPase